MPPDDDSIEMIANIPGLIAKSCAFVIVIMLGYCLYRFLNSALVQLAAKALDKTAHLGIWLLSSPWGLPLAFILGLIVKLVALPALAKRLAKANADAEIEKRRKLEIANENPEEEEEEKEQKKKNENENAPKEKLKRTNAVSEVAASVRKFMGIFRKNSPKSVQYRDDLKSAMRAIFQEEPDDKINTESTESILEKIRADWKNTKMSADVRAAFERLNNLTDEQIENVIELQKSYTSKVVPAPIAQFLAKNPNRDINLEDIVNDVRFQKPEQLKKGLIALYDTRNNILDSVKVNGKSLNKAPRKEFITNLAKELRTLPTSTADSTHIPAEGVRTAGDRAGAEGDGDGMGDGEAEGGEPGK